MKKICESLREHAMNIISFKTKNEVINEQQKWNAKICCIFFKKLKIDILKLKNIVKLEITIVF